MATPCLNISDSPQRRAEGEWRTVNLQLLKAIHTAQCWHDVKLAADALFHARLIFDSTYRDLFETPCESGASQSDIVVDASPSGDSHEAD
jgi:hypothetical protein